MNTTFKNTQHESAFNRQGFIVVNEVLTPRECTEILHYHAGLTPGLNTGFFASQNSPNRQYREAVENFLHPLFEQKIKPLFINHRVLYSQYMVKHSGNNGECQLHQDWTYVEEPRYTAVNFWCALTDTDTRNGCLWMAPGSHRLTHYIRGRNIERASLQEQPFIRQFLMTPVPLKKGQAVLFNSATLHESRNNLSGTDRIAAAAMIIPCQATPIHYMAQTQGSTNVVQMQADTPFYTEHCGNEIPANVTPRAHLIITKRNFTKLELLRCFLSSKF
ncbi:MAG: phytanoyl-CoA dioxygenase family protein [Chitinophagales bacterium]|nr:phytanoyl-CoA dioxygenase family protein [Chitinophagales bacterium]